MNSQTSATRILAFNQGEAHVPNNEEQESTLGKETATVVRDALVQIGFTLTDPNIVVGEGLWRLEGTFDEQRFGIDLGIFPIGETHEACWAVAFVPKPLGFFRKSLNSLSSDAQTKLRDYLQSIYPNANFRWLSAEEFAADI